MFMRIIKYRYFLIISAVFSLFLCSCVNSIEVEQEEEDEATNGTLLIKIESDALQKQIYDKERETSIGLFATLSTASLDKSRHIDNHKMVCRSDGFAPIAPIYYPSGKTKTDIISYHPYRTEGIKESSFMMDVSVALEQNTLYNYNVSDFMIAYANNITPSSKTVKLKYEHQFSQLNISIKIQDDTDPELIRKLNPKVVLNDVYTHATYHYDYRGYTNYSKLSALTPYGTWSVSNNKLIGKKCFIIPQVVSSSINFLTIIIGDDTYGVKLNNDYSFVNGSSSEIVVMYSSKMGINDVTIDVSDWVEGESHEVIPEEQTRFTKLQLIDFDFNKTSIYRVMVEGKAVAEVCKEFLFNDDTKYIGVVVYPVINGVTDLSSGRLWSVIDHSEIKVGGVVSWDKMNNSFSYANGLYNDLPYLYFDLMGNIHFDEPETCLKVNLEGKYCIDIRNKENIKYPIVKIGSQYWLGKDLQTKFYNTGAAIPYKTGAGYAKKTAGYFYMNSSFFYNKASIITGCLSPIGWHVADYLDWQSLKKYLNGESSFLKSIDSWKDSSYSPNNYSGFSAEPVGLFNIRSDKDESAYAFKGQYVAYWVMGLDPTSLADKSILLNLNSNEIKEGNFQDSPFFNVTRC